MILFMFCFGLLIGSFLNVIIYRLPRGESIILPPSHCPNCGQRLGFCDLIPLFSYLFLRGSCRYCHQKFSLRYPLVELLTGILSGIWALKYLAGITPEGMGELVLTYVLVAIAFIDFDEKVIPNKLTYPMIILGLVLKAVTGSFLEGAWGMLAGGGVLLVIALVYPKGMGLGDVKFLAMTGVFLGWEKVIISLFLSSFVGVLVMLPLMIGKKIDRKTPFAFGPFLVIATLIIIYGWDWLKIILPYT